MSGTQIRMTTGTEGPAWDPYGWTQYDVTRLGHTFSLRMGLGVSLEKDGMDVIGFDENELLSLFEQWTGLDPRDCEEYWHRIHRPGRCPDCGRPVVGLGGGFVGETVYGCSEHGMMYDDFHVSMIE